MSKKKQSNNPNGGLVIIAVIFTLALFQSIGEALTNHRSFVLSIIIFSLVLFISYLIYVDLYFKGSKFKELKKNIYSYIKECNDLDDHIEDLKNSYVNYHKIDFGEVQYRNAGAYNYKRKKIANATYSPYIYDCSKTVCENARKQPFKYVCKYFGIKPSKQTLEEFEEILNNFLSAEDGKIYLAKKKDVILNRISNDIPGVIKSFQSKR